MSPHVTKCLDFRQRLTPPPPVILHPGPYTGASFSARPYDQGRRVKLSYVDGSGTTLTNQDKAVYSDVGVMRAWTEGALRSDVEVIVRLKRTGGAATARRGELDLVGSFRSS